VHTRHRLQLHLLLKVQLLLLLLLLLLLCHSLVFTGSSSAALGLALPAAPPPGLLQTWLLSLPAAHPAQQPRHQPTAAAAGV
jgi:hypothetical protein